MNNFDWNKISTPAYVVFEELLIKNLEKLKLVQDKTKAKILLAQKGFSMFYTYPLLSKYLYGATASSLNEALLGKIMKKENHIFSPAYKEEEMPLIIDTVDHIVFNSFNQWNKYKDLIKQTNKHISCGIRINPEYSEITHEIYNPCAASSRLGVKLEDFESIEGLEGLHFHTMCEQNSDTLYRTWKEVEKKFSKYFSKIKWLNLGGGHHITKDDYDVDLLIKTINEIKDKYNLEVYLEPGEAIALNTGFLVSEVLEVVHNNIDIAILDTSAACHMPDVLEMPYRPNVINSGKFDEKKYNYRFAGPTCLAGDIIGDYSFDKPLEYKQKIVFTDMAHYSMVKNNTFNGVNLPSIVYVDKNRKIKIVKEFDYQDFKSRLS
ncbi:MAG: carboxynorspermidine decarboxylase [Bacilli bacterium]|nr:carboxynorspermidine decarboxylase [Bacilli bacterium]